MVRTAFQPQSRQQLDPIRIVAISVSIALNAALLVVLTHPTEIASLATQTDAPPIVIVTPTPKLRPLPQPIEKHPPHVTRVLPPQPIPHLPQPVVNPKPTPVSTLADTRPPTSLGAQDNQPPSTQPVEASLVPIASPAPTYPRDALRDEITGTVELELLVGTDGSVLDVHIVRSSGNRQLDSAARDQVLRNWRFQPAMRNGVAVQALGRVPIVFTLDER